MCVCNSACRSHFIGGTHSNFFSVVVATDRTMWAIGMSEEDRNALSELTAVQEEVDVDYYHAAKDGTGPPIPMAVLPTNCILRKGYNRVTIIQTDAPDQASQRLSEILIFDKEPHIQPLDRRYLKRDTSGGAAEPDETSLPPLQDISFGWKHQLVLV